MKQKAYTGWKDVSVFISSTFNDMHAERDYLVKFVFPELREWCAERKLRLNDIDLRWGITASDTETKRTLGICLRDIDESRPFFLGFLGQRRGWLPTEQDVDDGTREEYPRLSELLGRTSVTEMEIEHALLQPLLRMANGTGRNMPPAAHAFVFLRDDPFSGKLSPALRRVYTNCGEADPDEDPDVSERVRLADEDLRSFRARLEKRVPGVLHYQADFDPGIPSPELGGTETEEGRGRLVNFRVGGEALKDVVIREMKAAILAEHPDRAEPAPESSPEELRSLFLEKMAEGYIERPADLAALEEYVSAPSCRGPLLVYAASGAGKTTLLAEFYRRRKSRGMPALMRVCGVGREDSSVLGVFSSLFSALGIPLPVDSEELKERFSWYMDRLAESRALILIDALDQVPGGPEVLSWLAFDWPQDLRLIYSVRAGALEGDLSGEQLEKRGVRLYEVLPFDSDEDRRLLVDGYLRSHLKRLEEEHMDLLFRKKGASNPLYLLAALSELRLEGRFDRIAGRIAALGEEPEEVFGSMLARMEEDFLSPDFSGREVVPLLFAALSESRSGLTRDELHRFFALAFPQADSEAMDGLVQVYLRQIRDFLTQFSGVTDLRYFALRRAASARYKRLRRRVNELLAACFLQRMGPDYNGGSARDYEEGAVHLIRADADAAFYILSDYRFLRARLRLCGIRSLNEAFEQLCGEMKQYRPKEQAETLSRALLGSVYILEEHPEELAGQLAVRVSGQDLPRLTEQLGSCEESLWLRAMAVRSGSQNYKLLRAGETGVHSVWPYNGSLLVVFTSGLAELISDRDGSLLRVVREAGQDLNVTAACLSRDCLVMADAGGKVLCYDIRTGRLLGSASADGSFIRVLAADENRIYGADNSDFVYAWHPETLKPAAKMVFKGGAESLLAENGLLVLGGRREKILVCSAETLKPVHVLDPQLGTIWALALVGDRLYAAATEMLIAADLKSGLYTGAAWYISDVGATCCLLPATPSPSFLTKPDSCQELYRFTGKGANCYDPQLQKGREVSGILPSIRFIRRSGSQLFFVTSDDRIGMMDETALRDTASGSSGEARTVCFGSRVVVVMNSGGTIRLYDRESGSMLLEKDIVPLSPDRGQHPLRTQRVSAVSAWKDDFFIGTTGELVRMGQNCRVSETYFHKDYGGIFDSMGSVDAVAANDRYVAWVVFGELKIKSRFGGKEFTPDKKTSSHSLLMTENRLYSCSSDTLSVYWLDKEGLPCTRAEIPKGWRKLEAGEEALLLGYPDRILALDPETGETRGELYSGAVAAFTVCRGFLAVLPGDHSIRVFRNGRLYYALTTDEIPTAIASDRETGDIMVGTATAGFFRLRIEHPEKAEKPMIRAVAPPLPPRGKQMEAESERIPDVTRKGPVLLGVLFCALIALTFAGLGEWKSLKAMSLLYPDEYAAGMAPAKEVINNLSSFWFMAKRLPLVPILTLLPWFYHRVRRVKEESWWHWTVRELKRCIPWALACIFYGGLCLHLFAIGALAQTEKAHVIFSCACLLIVFSGLTTLFSKRKYSPSFGSPYAKRCFFYSISAIVGLITAVVLLLVMW